MICCKCYQLAFLKNASQVFLWSQKGIAIYIRGHLSFKNINIMFHFNTLLLSIFTLRKFSLQGQTRCINDVSSIVSWFQTVTDRNYSYTLCVSKLIVLTKMIWFMNNILVIRRHTPLFFPSWHHIFHPYSVAVILLQVTFGQVAGKYGFEMLFTICLPLWSIASGLW